MWFTDKKIKTDKHFKKEKTTDLNVEIWEKENEREHVTYLEV